jgi:uncharacterized protein
MRFGFCVGIIAGMADVVMNILTEMWHVLGEMSLYLLLGFLIAGVLSVLVSPEKVERHLGGRGVWPVIKGTLFGLPLPLCSCGVIPVATSLRKHGATRGATTAFLLTTPETGMDGILVTYSLLGLVFAVFRPIAAIITGLVGGLLVNLFDGNNANGPSADLRCDDACCSVVRRQRHGPVYRVFEHGFVTLPRDLAGSLLAGLAAAGVIAALVPANYFSNSLLGSGIWAMLVMMALSIPTYVCASASVPLALALLLKGVSPGAVFVFLISGPASNPAMITTIWRILGRRTAILYLATVAGMALAAGYVLDYIFTSRAIPIASQIQAHDMLPACLKTAGAAVLLVVLIGPIIYDYYTSSRRELPLDRAPGGVILKVTGMACAECAESVREALLNCTGVREANVNFHTGEARVRGENLNVECMHQLVRQLGFGIADHPEPCECRRKI